MPALNVINGDLQVRGHLAPNSMSLPASAVTNASVAADAAIDVSKLKHEHRARLSQGVAANATAQNEVRYVARAAGTVEEFVAGLVTPPNTATGGGGRSATVDLKKNGTTVLSGVITLDSTNVAYVVEAGTISVIPYVAGDVFTIEVALGGGSTGTHVVGLFAEAVFYEAAS